MGRTDVGQAAEVTESFDRMVEEPPEIVSDGELKAKVKIRLASLSRAARKEINAKGCD